MSNLLVKDNKDVTQVILLKAAHLDQCDAGFMISLDLFLASKLMGKELSYPKFGKPTTVLLNVWLLIDFME